jgi:hypothetical protein
MWHVGVAGRSSWDVGVAGRCQCLVVGVAGWYVGVAGRNTLNRKRSGDVTRDGWYALFIALTAS